MRSDAPAQRRQNAGSPGGPTEHTCEWGSGRPALATEQQGVAVKTQTAQEVAGERRILF